MDRKIPIVRKKAVTAIIIIILLIWAFVAFYLDNLFKFAVIKAGEAIFKAKVDIHRSHIQFSPFGITLTELQVANKNKPMENLFEIKTIGMSIHILPLFQKKTLIDQITIKDISLKTPRSYSGALPQKKSKKEAVKPEQKSKLTKAVTSQLAQLDIAKILQLPDVNQLVNVNNLESAKKFDQLKKNTESLNGKYNNALASLNYSERITALQKELDTLIKAPINLQDLKGLQDKAQKIQGMQKTVAEMQNTINDQKKQADADIKALNASRQKIQDSLNNDIDAIKKQIHLPVISGKNIGLALFGPAAYKRFETWQHYAELANQYRPKKVVKAPKAGVRDHGETVYFIAKHSLPTLWIKQIYISGVGKNQERISGEITHLASDQDITGQPTNIQLRFEHLFQPQATAITTIKLDRRNNQDLNCFDLRLSHFKSDPMDLYQSENQKIVLADCDINAKINITLSHEKLDGKFVVEGTKLNYQSQGIDPAAFSLPGIIWQVLNKTPLLSVSGTIKGALNAPELTLQSNLDTALTNGLNQVIADQTKKWNQELNTAIQAQISKAKQDADQLIAQTTSGLQNQYKNELAAIQNLQNSIQTEQKKLEAQKQKVETEINDKMNKEKEALNKEKEAAQKQAEKTIQNNINKLIKF